MRTLLEKRRICREIVVIDIRREAIAEPLQAQSRALRHSHHVPRIGTA